MSVSAYTFGQSEEDHKYLTGSSTNVDICERTTNYEERTLTTMKKLFISCPMRGRTNEAIAESRERMKKIAKEIFNEELEVIDSIISDRPPVDSKESIWYLGKSLEKLAEADYFIGVDYSEYFRGCEVERGVAQRYGIPTFCVPLYIFPDALELDRRMYKYNTEDYVKREIFPDPNC